jgi:hypothetical protein
MTEASLDGLSIEDGSLFYRLMPEGCKQLDRETGQFGRLVRAIQFMTRAA